MEYRGKLSELAMSDYPRLPLASINSRIIAADTPHGRANASIMKSYAKWVAAHSAEVKGYDPKLPAAVQIDRLSDDQIRAVARSLDPWARAS